MIINKTTLTIQDAQYLLGSSAYSIYKLIHEGKLYAYKDDAVRCGKYQNKLS